MNLKGTGFGEEDRP